MSFLKNINEVSLAGVAFKNMTLKKSIIRYLDVHETATIADLGQTLNISTPKITSTVNELIEEGLMKEIGKIDSTGGRRANMFGLGADAGFFMGVEVTKNHVTIGLMDFKKKLVKVKALSSALGLSWLLKCMPEREAEVLSKRCSVF